MNQDSTTIAEEPKVYKPSLNAKKIDFLLTVYMDWVAHSGIKGRLAQGRRSLPIELADWTKTNFSLCLKV